MSTLSTKLFMALAISMALVACKSTPMKPATVEDKSPSATTASNAKPADNNGADTNAIKSYGQAAVGLTLKPGSACAWF